MSWEDELNDIEKEEKGKEKKKGKKAKKMYSMFGDESEVIEVKKQVKQETIREKDKPIDYEKKYNERKKADMDLEKEIEESVKNIQDPELRLKKKLELMELRRAAKFLEGDDKNEKKEEKEIDLNFPLKAEKDYIDLATKSAARINNLGKGNKFTLEFLRGSIEELLPTLDEDSMEELIKSIKIISTKKSKEKGGKKKNNKNEPKKEEKVEKPLDKFEERKALYKQYGDGDPQGPPAEDDSNDDGDFM